MAITIVKTQPGSFTSFPKVWVLQKLQFYKNVAKAVHGLISHYIYYMF